MLINNAITIGYSKSSSMIPFLKSYDFILDNIVDCILILIDFLPQNRYLCNCTYVCVYIYIPEACFIVRCNRFTTFAFNTNS